MVIRIKNAHNLILLDVLVTNQKYIVMERISSKFTKRESLQPKSNIKRVVYAGTSHEKFGIIQLLEAYREVDVPNTELCICGLGDSEYRIKAVAAKRPSYKISWSIRSR